ncbi:MAG: helix-turn-helix transcriptional regulator [Mariniblastus sp.]|nr:helix-turn-helix transcriptional regulator [Mariniblastus sp.]
MQYSFRLAELLGHVPDPRKRPGTIKSIVEYTGLDRHQVAALLKNEVKYIPLKALSRLCDYLIEHGHATADQLPGALFAVEPENFWELLARRKRLEMCVGVRRDVSADSPDVSFVVAADSVLLGEILNGVTTLGGTAKLRKPTPEMNMLAADALPHPEQLKQSLVWSPGQADENEVARRAWMVYNDFSESKGDKALIGIGSTKSNPVVEIVLARAFNCDPFESQDGAADPKDRAIPFFMRYRDNDPHPNSCVAGLNLSQGEAKLKEGLYYENADGNWIRCGADNKNEEVAFVFYVHRESQGRLEMVLGGFSGRATRLLARALATRAEDFWPPIYEMQGIQVGGFIAKFTLPSTKKEEDILRTDLVASTEVTTIPMEAFQRRLERGRV